MRNDSVREELQTKISPATVRPMQHSAPEPSIAAPPVTVAPPVNVPAPTPPPPRQEINAASKPAPAVSRVTQEFHAQKTSQTLVEFQAKQTAVPDWRLQLQNSVRQRRGSSNASATDSKPQPARMATRGANALKAEPVAESKAEAQSAVADPRVANALKRIDHSRKTFAPPSKQAATPAKSPMAREFPFNVVARGSQPAAPPVLEKKAAINPALRPKLIPTFKIEKSGYDTNKLPALTTAVKLDDVADLAFEVDESVVIAVEPEVLAYAEETDPENDEVVNEEALEDLAPISMRFNAGLFDLIIGAFAAFALISPLIFLGGNWFTGSGILAFAATWAIVMFVYLTASIGMYGRTIGMRMFSLEVIDAEENDYPTFHQAAVSAAVYLLTIPMLGLGFLPALFNEEQRTAYDLASGTIIVTEF